ncbi:MAG: hypothetical protein C0600_04945 [Ignavibacteria bacterium]|nr:MAG: hypothetical protein C0600_04945 [Ignavibacteria bacterium]
MPYPKYEYKYLIRNEQLDTIRARILEMCDYDPYAARLEKREYTVRSVYYDTRDMQSYYEKIEGIKYRRKYRVRVYGEHAEDSLSFLEIKHKRGALLTKYRSPVLYSNLDAFFHDETKEQYVLNLKGDGVSRENARRFMYHYYRRQLHPVVLVTYDREPFVGRYNGDLRLTLDKRVRAIGQPTLDGMYDENGLVSSLKGHTIFEVKFTRGIPQWCRTLIGDLSLKRQALSKYTICLDSLNRGQRRSTTSRSAFFAGNGTTIRSEYAGRIH